MDGKRKGAVQDGMEIHWKSEAIVEADSRKFSAELERILNDNTADGYQLTQLIFREKDNGAVLLFQRCVIVMGQPPTSVPGTEKKEAN